MTRAKETSKTTRAVMKAIRINCVNPESVCIQEIEERRGGERFEKKGAMQRER